MESNFLTFSLSPTQLKYKKILSKDFLELDVYAISDIDPNRNNTHFTLEGLKKGLATFRNKPIVGLFRRGDFGAHDGRLTRDKELDNIYWDTEYGEQILGFIRESDTVEIVEKDGLHWIHFTCVLCIRYCYLQAKKLLKDKSKKVSVEIEVTSKKIREDGIEDIYDFNLGGVTILGTKDGRPVIEAIPGATASVLELLDEVALEGQREVLCYAYQEMESKRDIDNQKSKKEEKIVDENKQNELRDLLTSKLSSYTFKKEDGSEDYRFSVGEVFDSHIMALDNKTGEQHEVKYAVDENGGCKFYCDELKTLAAEEECKNACDGEPQTACNNSADSEEGGEPAQECNNSAEGEKCGCDGGEPATECNNSAEDGDDDNDDDDDDDDKDEDHEDGKCPGCGEPVGECKCTAQLMECKGELKTLQEEYGKVCEELKSYKASCDEYKNRCDEMSAKLESCKDYAEIKERLEAAESKLFGIRCEEFRGKAMSLMSTEKIADEDRKEIEQKCSDGKYSSEEELVRDIGYAVFKSHLSSKGAEQYSAGIVAPPTIEQENNKSKNKPSDRAKRIADYAAGKK